MLGVGSVCREIREGHMSLKTQAGKRSCVNLGRATETKETAGTKALMRCAERARRMGPEARQDPPSGQWLAFDCDWVRQDLRAQGLKAEGGRSQSLR